MKIILPIVFILISLLCFKIQGFIKNRLWKEAIIFILLMLISIAYAYHVFGIVKMPSPTGFIDIIYKPLSEFIFEQ